MHAAFRTIDYRPGTLILIDQTRLPREESYVELSTVEDVARAIETMIVRGAPAIGITAAFGMAIAARTKVPLEAAHARLAKTRPTAVNLFYALARIERVWDSAEIGAEALEQEAWRIYEEEAVACRKMGEIGAKLVPDGATILTHCNTGALATSELGTALGVIRTAHAQGKQIKVFADETRPRLQGARLTAWELMRDGIDVTLISDTAAGHFIGRGEIDLAFVGADRIAKNGDVANKIGTRTVACLMHAAERPFYVVAPWSTVDWALERGEDIPIEERDGTEVTHIEGRAIAPEGVSVRNPAFDVTPARWIQGIITERGFTGPDVGRGLAERRSSND